MFPIKQILLRLSAFIGLYVLLLILSGQPFMSSVVRKQAVRLLADYTENAYPNYEFRFKQDEKAKGLFRNVIKLMHFSQSEIQVAKEEARRLGKATVTLKPPAVLRIDLYNALLIPLFFLWSLFAVTPMPWKQKIGLGLVGTSLFLIYALLNVHFIVRSSLPDANWIATVATFYTVGLSIFVAIVIWALLSIRKMAWDRMIHP